MTSAATRRLLQGGDRYEVIERIGAGGMGSVWRAWDTFLHRPVAIKRIHPRLAAHRELTERFKKEATSAASLSHPGIVTVHDGGEDAEGPYLVMELVGERSLADLLREREALPPVQAAAIAAEVAQALEYAHQRGVVHRDVKPSNILLDGVERPVVTDFGLAEHAAYVQRHRGRSTVLGTPAYMAPEATGEGGSRPAADVYSLGVVLYHMLAGRPPFRGDTPQALAFAHRTAPVPLPSDFADVPEGLERIVLRALEKDPERRFPSAGHLASALASWLAEEEALASVTLEPGHREQEAEIDVWGSTKVEAAQGAGPLWLAAVQTVVVVLTAFVLLGGYLFVLR